MTQKDTAMRALMESAAYEAGKKIMRYYRPGQTVAKDADVRAKGYDNPLTQADLEADAILRRMLTADHPDYGWLSEETADDFSRLNCQRVWVVDPIDGTKEFIGGIPQFAISIGLVEASVPVAACIYNPASEQLFSALQGCGAYLNNQKIQATARTDLLGASCLASRSETKRGEWAEFQAEFSIRDVGSIAYKLAILAAGEADLTFTLTPKNAWDFCAGDLILQEAQGILTDKNGQRFVYNQKSTRVSSVLASNGHLHSALVQRLASTPLNPGRRDR